MIEEFRDLDKLGQWFTSVNPLEKVDIGDGNTTRPTIINKNLKSDSREMFRLLRD